LWRTKPVQRLGYTVLPYVLLNDQPLVDGWYLEHPNTHDAFHIVDREDLDCSAMVDPASTQEVQTIVKLGNQYAIPL
jgi:hypothetical protein